VNVDFCRGGIDGGKSVGEAGRLPITLVRCTGLGTAASGCTNLDRRPNHSITVACWAFLVSLNRLPHLAAWEMRTLSSQASRFGSPAWSRQTPPTQSPRSLSEQPKRRLACSPCLARYHSAGRRSQARLSSRPTLLV
jgi:hypothetical protein